jgi:hypothetical protein
VTGDDRRLAIAFSVFVALEERGAQIALQVARADPDGVDTYDDFAGIGRRYSVFLETIIFGRVADDGSHRFGKIVRHFETP